MHYEYCFNKYNPPLYPCNNYNPNCTCNCITQAPLLSPTSGNFNFPCDGCKRQIFASSTPLTNFNMVFTNTCGYAIIVELSQLISNILSTKTFTVNPSSTSTITDTNVVNVFVIGVPINIISCCYQHSEGNRSFTSYKNYNSRTCFGGCTGTYNITTSTP